MSRLDSKLETRTFKKFTNEIGEDCTNTVTHLAFYRTLMLEFEDVLGASSARRETGVISNISRRDF